MVLVAKSIARGNVFNPDNRVDITRVTGLYVFALIGLNLDQTRDAFALVGARIINRVAFAQCARVNPEKDKFADKRIAPQFEGKRTEISVVISDCFHRLVRVGFHALGRRNVERTRQIIDYRIDQVLHAFIL